MGNRFHNIRVFYGLLIVCCSSALSSNAQNMALEEVKEKMGIYHVNFPQEKVYVHHDKPHYVLGEQIWYKVYLVSAILHDPLTPSQQVTVELIDPGNVVLSTATIRIEEGGGNGDFRLGADWETGKYLIRAYTNYQRNFEEPFFFEKEIRVYNAYTSIGEISVRDQNDVLEEPGNDSSMSETDLNVLFFPEGGDLIAGITTKVAVNAINRQFEGETLQGSIVTSSGTIVSRFSTHKTGLGVFKLIPESGEIYSAKVSYRGEEVSFKLPEVKDIGYSLSITESLDTLTILVSSNSPTGLTGTFVVGHIRGQLIGLVEGLSGSKSMFRLPLNDAPDGVLHFTLFTSEGIPVSERLVFALREKNKHQVDFTLSKDSFGAREEVTFSVQNQPGESGLNGSLTVTELALASPDKYSTDIRTYLLMESDLRGRIPDPGYFFEEERTNKNLLDLLMLTHGWRRFEWDNLLNDPVLDVQWFPENSLSLKGYTTKYGNVEKRVKSRIFLTTLTDDFSMQELVSDENGYFEFTGVSGYDTIPLLLQASIYKENIKEKKKQKKGEGPIGNRYVDIFIENGDRPQVDRKNSLLDKEQPSNVLQEYFMASRKTNVVDSAYKNLVTYQLDEVVVQAEKFDPIIADRPNVLYGEPDRRLVVDSTSLGSLARSVFELIRGRFPGVTVVGSFPTYNVIMRGANSIQGDTYAVFLLDGAVVDVSLINVLPVARVAFIDVLSSLSKSAIYGTSGNGVIAIYTKTGNEMVNKEVVGSLNYTFPGYYKPNTFYSPDYGKEKNSIKPDVRTTLFWEPEIKITTGKPRKLSFYTSDKSTVYSLRFEGITSDGTPVVFRKKFEVK